MNEFQQFMNGLSADARLGRFVSPIAEQSPEVIVLHLATALADCAKGGLPNPGHELLDTLEEHREAGASEEVAQPEPAAAAADIAALRERVDNQGALMVRLIETSESLQAHIRELSGVIGTLSQNDQNLRANDGEIVAHLKTLASVVERQGDQLDTVASIVQQHHAQLDGGPMFPQRGRSDLN